MEETKLTADEISLYDRGIMEINIKVLGKSRIFTASRGFSNDTILVVIFTKRNKFR